jgi:hypothetical protein
MDITTIIISLLTFFFDRNARLRLFGYRPEVICIIQGAENKKILFIQPRANQEIWSPPQEGIEPRESIEQASKRCIEVELGIRANHTQYRRSVWISKRRLPSTRKGERDLTFISSEKNQLIHMIGKAYYAAHIIVDDNIEIKPNKAEVSSWKWLSHKNISEHLESIPKDKQAILLTSLEKLIK